MADRTGTPQDFLELSDRVLELYRAGAFGEALGAVEAAAGRFPTRQATVVFWRACLQSVTGRSEDALASFKRGLDDGLCWSERFLNDPDLEPLFGRAEFQEVVEESARRLAALPRHEVSLRTVEPPGEPRGLLLALHGAAWDPDEFARHWGAGADAGFLVAVPNSSLAMGPEEFTWDEPDGAERDVGRAFDLAFSRFEAQVESGRRCVVLAGFSQGGRIALDYALRGTPVPVTGYLGVGPGINDPDGLARLARGASERGLRAAFIVGDRDSLLDPVEKVHASLLEAGLASVLDIVPGLGHWFPEDFAERLPRALAFIAGR
jgi:pimeloyl-ACP methyl ester carboxylesterase